MSAFQALLLGAVQGLTEFLPVSSTAHLTLLQHLWRTNPAARLSLDVALHLGTAFALIAFFRSSIAEVVTGRKSDVDKPPSAEPKPRNWRPLLYIAIGTLPAALIGLLFDEHIDRFFRDIRFPAVFLLVTGTILFITRRARGNRTTITWRDGLLIGIAQAVALLPGISRSGATIATALFLGLAATESFEFSFLLSIPAVLGASALKLRDAFAPGTLLEPMPLLIGVVTSCLVGLTALWLLRGIMRQRRFWLFAFYGWVAGALILLFVR